MELKLKSKIKSFLKDDFTDILYDEDNLSFLVKAKMNGNFIAIFGEAKLKKEDMMSLGQNLKLECIYNLKTKNIDLVTEYGHSLFEDPLIVVDNPMEEFDNKFHALLYEELMAIYQLQLKPNLELEPYGFFKYMPQFVESKKIKEANIKTLGSHAHIHLGNIVDFLNDENDFSYKQALKLVNEKHENIEQMAQSYIDCQYAMEQYMKSNAVSTDMEFKKFDIINEFGSQTLEFLSITVANEDKEETVSIENSALELNKYPTYAIKEIAFLGGGLLYNISIYEKEVVEAIRRSSSYNINYIKYHEKDLFKVRKTQNNANGTIPKKYDVDTMDIFTFLNYMEKKVFQDIDFVKFFIKEITKYNNIRENKPLTKMLFNYIPENVLDSFFFNMVKRDEEFDDAVIKVLLSCCSKDVILRNKEFFMDYIDDVNYFKFPMEVQTNEKFILKLIDKFPYSALMEIDGKYLESSNIQRAFDACLSKKQCLNDVMMLYPADKENTGLKSLKNKNTVLNAACFDNISTASKEVLRDKDFLYKFVQKKKKSQVISSHDLNKFLLALDDDIKDEEFILNIIKYFNVNEDAWNLIPDDTKKSELVQKEFVMKCHGLFLVMDKKLQNMMVLRNPESMFSSMNNKVVLENDTIEKIIKNNSNYILYLSKEQKEDKDFLLRLLKLNPSIYPFIPNEYKVDRDFLRVLLDNKISIIEQCNSFGIEDVFVEANKDLLMEDLKNSPISFRYIIYGKNDNGNPKLIEDKDFMLYAVGLDVSNAYNLPKAFYNDNDIAMAVLSKQSTCIDKFPKKIFTKDFSLKLIKARLDYIDTLDYDMRVPNAYEMKRNLLPAIPNNVKKTIEYEDLIKALP